MIGKYVERNNSDDDGIDGVEEVDGRFWITIQPFDDGKLHQRKQNTKRKKIHFGNEWERPCFFSMLSFLMNETAEVVDSATRAKVYMHPTESES